MASRSGGRGGRPPRDGDTSKRKRQGDEIEAGNGNASAVSVDRQILNGLNNLAGLVNTQNSLLRSIDARLGRMERQGQQLGRQPHRRDGPPARETVQGTWMFAKSHLFETTAEAAMRRSPSYSIFQPVPAPDSAFGKIEEGGLMLSGDAYIDLSRNVAHSLSVAYPQNGLRHHPSVQGGFQSLENGLPARQPHWSRSTDDVRALLPQLIFNGKSEIRHKTGIYAFVVKYTGSSEKQNQDAGIIVGEMEFNSKGYVLAEGADWDRLLNNQRQTQLPYSHNARGVATWLHRNISEPWMDGDELKFRVDTNENTVVFQKGRHSPEKTFWNALAFTNNPKYPEFLRVYAYCGGGKCNQDDSIDVKLTICG